LRQPLDHRSAVRLILERSREWQDTSRNTVTVLQIKEFDDARSLEALTYCRRRRVPPRTHAAADPNTASR
jgi:hypothetical protein